MSATPLKRRGRQLRKGDERETDLMHCAEQRLTDGSFAEASVADLAAAAGVSRPTFYFYFASKDALLASVIEAAHAEIARALEAALIQPGTPGERLDAAIRTSADAWWKNRAAMSAAMQVGRQIPQLGERMMASMHTVNLLCAELLCEHGTVPEREDPDAALALVESLALLNERVFSHAVPLAGSRSELAPVSARLLAIWTRSLGIRIPEQSP